MKSLLNAVAISTLLAGTAIFALPASAGPETGTLQLQFNTGNPETLFPAGFDAMRIFYKNDSGTEKEINVAAGMFSGVAVEGDNTTINTATLFKDVSNVLAYCIDIMQVLDASAKYDLESITPGQVHTDPISGVQRNFGRMLSFLGAVNQVMQGELYGFEPDSKNWLRPDPSKSWMSGAIQLGIWESLYENPQEILSVILNSDQDNEWFRAGGNTSRTSVHEDGLSFLDDVFELVNTSDDFTPLSASEVVWAKNADGQDLLIDPVDVPVPATGLLLIGGLGAFAWRRRKIADL